MKKRLHQTAISEEVIENAILKKVQIPHPKTQVPLTISQAISVSGLADQIKRSLRAKINGPKIDTDNSNNNSELLSDYRKGTGNF